VTALLPTEDPASLKLSITVSYLTFSHEPDYRLNKVDQAVTTGTRADRKWKYEQSQHSLYHIDQTFLWVPTVFICTCTDIEGGLYLCKQLTAHPDDETFIFGPTLTSLMPSLSARARSISRRVTLRARALLDDGIGSDRRLLSG
jgi:hypothetical protein